MLKAVIEIGSTGIRLLVAELAGHSSFSVLDSSEQAVNLGRDVFTSGSISRETMLLCLKILSRYAEQLRTWGITPEETIVAGTSAVREAQNRDAFVDRVHVKTGFNVYVIDGIDENRLMYHALADRFRQNQKYSLKNSIVLEISGGATEIMILEKDRIMSARSLRLGPVIIEQMIHSVHGTLVDSHRFINEYVRSLKNLLQAEFQTENIVQFVAIGSDMKIAALHAGKSAGPFMWQIEREKFLAFVRDIEQYTIDECIARFKLNSNDAHTFQLSLISYSHFLELSDAKIILVPEASIRDGILLSAIQEDDAEIRRDFERQIMASALTLLKKYQGDLVHAECVRKNSLKLYDSLEKEIGLDSHSRTLLQISAILHDVGMFVSALKHNEHGKYIVENSEIFGLSRDDKNLVAMIIGFHSGSILLQNNNEFRMLSRANRLVVLKLAAILRTADALDRTHQQKMKEFSIHINGDTITLRSKNHINTTLEKLALEQKSDLFQNVFGYKIVIS